MEIPYRRTAFLAVTAVVAASCSSTPSPGPSPTPGPVEPPSAEARAADAALAAYRTFWTVTDSALAAPLAKDWDAELEAVASGQALDKVRADVANYASLPAHTEGVVSRAPVVEVATTDRVVIVDCVDLGGSRLVSDTDGKVLDDLANRVQRYRFRADIVVEGTGRWVVDHTAPALDEPC